MVRVYLITKLVAASFVIVLPLPTSPHHPNWLEPVGVIDPHDDTIWLQAVGEFVSVINLHGHSPLVWVWPGNLGVLLESVMTQVTRRVSNWNHTNWLQPVGVIQVALGSASH